MRISNYIFLFMFCMNCAICQEEMLDIECTYDTPCKHVFHRACMLGWIKCNIDNGKDVLCPLCKRLCVVHHDQDQDYDDCSPYLCFIPLTYCICCFISFLQ